MKKFKYQTKIWKHTNKYPFDEWLSLYGGDGWKLHSILSNSDGGNIISVLLEFEF